MCQAKGCRADAWCPPAAERPTRWFRRRPRPRSRPLARPASPGPSWGRIRRSGCWRRLCGAWLRPRVSSNPTWSSGSTDCSRAWSFPCYALAPPRPLGSAAHQPDPAGAGEGVKAQCNKSQRDGTQQDASEGLAQQELERSSEALGLARVVVDAGLDEEPANDQKNNATGEHPKTAEPHRDVPLGWAHLRAFQVLREIGFVGLEELPQGDGDRDEAEEGRQRTASGVDEDGSNRFLGAVAGGSAGPREELESPDDDGRIGECARDEAKPGRVSRCVAATVQRVVDRPDEAP